MANYVYFKPTAADTHASVGKSDIGKEYDLNMDTRNEIKTKGNGTSYIDYSGFQATKLNDCRSILETLNKSNIDEVTSKYLDNIPSGAIVTYILGAERIHNQATKEVGVINYLLYNNNQFSKTDGTINNGATGNRGTEYTVIIPDTSEIFKYTVSNIVNNLKHRVEIVGKFSLSTSTVVTHTYESGVELLVAMPVRCENITGGTIINAQNQTVDYNTSVSYSFNVNNHYSAESPKITFLNGRQTNYTWNAASKTITFPNVQNAVQFSIEFIREQYTLTFTANNPLWGTVTGSGTYYYSDEVVYRAIPQRGYKFLKWSDGDTNAARRLWAYKDLSLTANFVPANVFVVLDESDEIYLGINKADVYVGTTKIFES